MNTEKRQRALRTFLYYIAYAGLGLSIGVFGPSLLRLAENTSTTIAQVSTMFFFHSLGYMVGSVVGGRGYDRFSGHPIISFTLVCMAITLAVTPLINILWVLIVVMLLLGVAQGGLDVGGNTLLLWTYGSKVGPYMNGLHLFFGIGAFMAPVLVAQSISTLDNLNLAYWGMAALMLVPAVGLPFISSPSQADETDDSDESGGRSNVLLMGMAAAFLVFYIGMEHAITGWIPTYATTTNLLNEVSAAYAISVFWGSFTLGRILSVPIAIKLRPRQVLTVDLLGCFAGILIMLLLPGSAAVLRISLAVTGFFAAPLFPTIITFTKNRMPLSGKTTSLFFVGASIGGMFFPWLIGQCYAGVGPRMVPMTIAASAALLIMLFVFLVRKFPEKAIS